MVHVGFIPHATLEYREEPNTGILHRKFELYLPEDPELSTHARPMDIGFWIGKQEELDRRRSVVIATPEHPIRTPSLGGIVLYRPPGGELTHAVFMEKDANAQNDPGSLTCFNGYPENRGEWEHPTRGVIRESIEEGAIQKSRSQNGIIVPNYPGIFRVGLVNKVSSLTRETGLEFDEEIPIDMGFVREMFRDTLEIRDERGNLYSSQIGAVNWNPITGFNFIQPLAIDYEGDHPADDLWISSAEVNRNSDYLISEDGVTMTFLDLREIQGKVFGDTVLKRNQRTNLGDDETHLEETVQDTWITDLVPRSALNQVRIDAGNGEKPVYPIAPSIEAMALLEIPEVREAYTKHGVRFSDMETFLAIGGRPDQLLHPTILNRFLRKHEGAQ